MAKRPTKKSALPNEATASLISALEFVSVAQRHGLQAYNEFCYIGNRQAIAFDGMIAAGALVDNDLTANPKTEALLAALKQCGASLSITQLASGRLSLKSDPFKAIVPCAEPSQMPTPPRPDPPLAPCDDRLKAAFAALAWVIADAGDRVIDCCYLVRKNTIVVTNGHVLIEYWHGWDMPTFNLPKTSATAICKIAKPLKAFGFDGRSITFWFEDDSWIKSQLYEDKYPDIDKILNFEATPQPLPEGFATALAAVSNFTDSDNKIMLDSVGMSTSPEDNEGASYELPGMLPSCFNKVYLKKVSEYAKTVDFQAKSDRIEHSLAFYGDSMRGIVAGMRMPQKSRVIDKAWEKPTNPETGQPWTAEDMDKDIPF